MTYREYFDQPEHRTENFSWCTPYTCTTDTGDYSLVMHDGEVNAIKTPTGTAYQWGTLDDNTLEQFARDVNANYDAMSTEGCTDLEIALDAMQEIGCIHCPFCDNCETMGEEMSDIDYR